MACLSLHACCYNVQRIYCWKKRTNGLVRVYCVYRLIVLHGKNAFLWRVEIICVKLHFISKIFTPPLSPTILFRLTNPSGQTAIFFPRRTSSPWARAAWICPTTAAWTSTPSHKSPPWTPRHRRAEDPWSTPTPVHAAVAEEATSSTNSSAQIQIFLGT